MPVRCSFFSLDWSVVCSLICSAANVLYVYLPHLNRHSPLVHCMTNSVVQTFTAQANALLINMGTLDVIQRDAMRTAVASARIACTPRVLDPVAVGALELRTAFVYELLAQPPTTIRGNASEIIALAGGGVGGRGVDATDSVHDAKAMAIVLAQRCTTVVAVTGETDYVTDGKRMLAVSGGSPLMTRVVGTGCALSAVVAARKCRGPGSFVAAFLDALYTLPGEEVQRETH